MIQKENFYSLMRIDAWRDGGCWIWSQWHREEEDIYIAPDATTREILKMLRGEWLSESSKGRVAVEDDQYNLVIVARGTREPIFALEPQWCR